MKKEIVVNGVTYKVQNKKINYKDYWDNLKRKNLFDVYNSCSSAKIKAWEYCKELEKKFNGNNLSIASFNTFGFSATFDFEHDGENYLMYITKAYDRIYRLV